MKKGFNICLKLYLNCKIYYEVSTLIRRFFIMQRKQLDLLLIGQEATVVESMKKIDGNAKGILFIIDDESRLLGVVTDGDIRRWLIKTGNLQENISEIMNRNHKWIYHKDIKLAQAIMKKKCITALPVVTLQGIVTDIIFKQEEKNAPRKLECALTDVAVVIMAGGKGTRLYPYTKILPKPLIPIGDIPIMERIIDKFRDFGVKDFYTTLNYKKNMIKSYFNDIVSDYNITYVEEDKPLGTAGSLQLIEDEFSIPLIVTNCDVLIHVDYGYMYKYHKDSGNELTIVTALKNIEVPYGVVRSGENGVVVSLDEKPKLSYFVNTGMYVLNPELLKEIPQDTFFHMTDLTEKLLEQGRKVGMYPISEDSFLDMGEFEEMRRMEEKLNLKSE